MPINKFLTAIFRRKRRTRVGDPMRYYVTCSVSAMPVDSSLVSGVVVNVYSVPDPHKGDPRRSLGGRRIVCRLDNGVVIDRYVVEYKHGEDGILEYWN